MWGFTLRCYNIKPYIATYFFMLNFGRFPGRLFALDEAPHPPILVMAAAQHKVPTGAWHFNAERHETRPEHLLELQEQFCFQTFTRAHDLQRTTA
jgi:hypothetical protein